MTPIGWVTMIAVFCALVLGALRLLRTRDESIQNFSIELQKLQTEVEQLSNSENAHADLITMVAESALKDVNS